MRCFWEKRASQRADLLAQSLHLARQLLLPSRLSTDITPSTDGAVQGSGAAPRSNRLGMERADRCYTKARWMRFTDMAGVCFPALRTRCHFCVIVQITNSSRLQSESFSLTDTRGVRSTKWFFAEPKAELPCAGLQHADSREWEGTHRQHRQKALCSPSLAPCPSPPFA